MKKVLTTIVAALLIASGIYLSYRQGVRSGPTPSGNSSMAMSMSMGGDASKRYTVSFATNPAAALPNQAVTLKFKIYDAASGNPVTNYAQVMTQLMHLVIVDSSLTYFNHIHPAQNGSEFSIVTQFPKADQYHLYVNFQPAGAAEQQMGFSLAVGAAKPGQPPMIDSSLTKIFGSYQVALSASENFFSASAMNNSAEILNFHITDAKTSQPITDLQPYLGAFGHLVMINEQTYNYVHIHPVASDNPVAGGPDVKFLPAALFDKIEPGIYRVFGQFKRHDQVFVADFTIKINP